VDAEREVAIHDAHVIGVFLDQFGQDGGQDGAVGALVVAVFDEGDRGGVLAEHVVVGLDRRDQRYEGGVGGGQQRRDLAALHGHGRGLQAGGGGPGLAGRQQNGQDGKDG